MAGRKFSLLHKDAFFCTLMTFLVAGIFYGIFVQLSVFDPFEKAFKDFNFTDIFYSKQFKPVERNDKIILINVKHVDRFQIARAIEAISEQQPKVIGLDMIFREKRNAFTDSVLRASLGRTRNLVMAYYREGDSLVKSHPYFEPAQMNSGYINLNLEDQNSVIRNFLGVQGEDKKEYSFATQLAIQGGFIDTSFAHNRLDKPLPINYIGKKEAFLTFDIEEIIEGKPIPAIKDALVILGYMGENSEFDIEDKHFTPLNAAYVGRSVPDTFGVTIHANILHMITQGDFIKRTPKFLVYLLSFLICFGLIMLGMKVYRRSNFAYDLGVKFMQLIISIILLYLAFILLRAGLYLNTAPILILAVLGVEMIEYYVYLIEWINKKYRWRSYLLDS